MALIGQLQTHTKSLVTPYLSRISSIPFLICITWMPRWRSTQNGRVKVDRKGQKVAPSNPVVMTPLFSSLCPTNYVPLLIIWLFYMLGLPRSSHQYHFVSKVGIICL